MDWQPIETCPRGGVLVELKTPSFTPEFSRVPGHESGAPYAGRGWINKWGDHCWIGLGDNPRATAWRPLPPVPNPS
jgi:hypothetical protein